MKRNGLIVLLVASSRGSRLAIVLGGCGQTGSDSSAQSGASPACLPATLEPQRHAGRAPVDVSPAPETDTANPNTQISFLGVPAAEIHEVSVVGERSGASLRAPARLLAGRRRELRARHAVRRRRARGRARA